MGGDLTVATAVTLTVEPGVTLRFSTSDAMGAGENTGEVELRVIGQLVAVGTPSSPIVLDSSGSGTNAWHGLLLLGTGTSTFEHVRISEATYGFPSGRGSPRTRCSRPRSPAARRAST
ncbi:MAG: hypothetical protein M5U28_27535 [Sandaracinaceae bacterium]|nr:hypothetical protein [Sandaracinaceae bacterium]